MSGSTDSLVKPDGTKIRVLVTDDSAFMIKKTTEYLMQFGMDVVGTAANGEEALALYPRLKPDLVTMDINMPKKDGIETLSGIIQMDSQAKVIMVSALGFKEKVREALEKGATYFIVKPLTPEKIEQNLLPILKKMFGIK